MRIWRSLILLFFGAALAGWWHFRRPASPTDDLPPVTYHALELAQTPTLPASEMLRQLETWAGITAVAYSAPERLLSLSITRDLPLDKLIERLQHLTGTAVAPKVFSAQGPQCPVPAGLIQQLPFYCLLTASGFLLLLGLSFLPFRNLRVT